MRDLQEMESCIRNPESKPHYHEAILAYQAGAYRASIVETWVAVTVDLVFKMRCLMEAGDKQAKSIIEDLDRAIENESLSKLKTFERDLLQNANEMAIITDHEKEMLGRLKEDRNYCAHPAYVTMSEIFSPSSELARSHLALAIDYCLALPSTPGRRVVEMFMSDIDSDSWPSRGDHVPEFIRMRYLERARPSTKLQLVKNVLIGAVEPVPANELHVINPVIYAYRCRYTINAIYSVDNNLLRESLALYVTSRRESGKLKDDDLLIRCLGAVGHLPAFWEVLTDDEIIRIASALKNRGATDIDTPFDAVQGTRMQPSLVELCAFASGTPSNETVAKTFVQIVEELKRKPFCHSDLISQATYGGDAIVPVAIAAMRKAKTCKTASYTILELLSIADMLSSKSIAALCDAICQTPNALDSPDTPRHLLSLYYETCDGVDNKCMWEKAANDFIERYDQAHLGKDSENPYRQLYTVVNKSH